MKKFLILFCMMIGFVTTSFAETQTYRTTAYAFARIYNGVYSWGDWQRSSMNVTFDLNSDRIIIYSPTIQVYSIVSAGQRYIDNEGGSNVAFRVIDQDNDRGTVRLRIYNGTSQIYVDFSDCAWVYNVIRTS